MLINTKKRSNLMYKETYKIKNQVKLKSCIYILIISVLIIIYFINEIINQLAK